MTDETHQTVSLPEERELALPQIDRIIVKDVKERIILRRGKRKFNNLAHKIRKNRAATTSHWFQVSDVGNGHVIRKLEEIVPLLITVHGAGAKSATTISLHVTVDSGGSADELRALAVQLPVVVQIVNVKFTSPPANLEDILIRDRVTLLGYNLKR